MPDPQANSRPASPDDRLEAAVRAGDFSAAKAALEAGANPNTFWDYLNRSALHWATCANSVAEICRELVRCGADLNGTDLAGQTALHYAAAEGRTEAVRVLLELGADPNVRDYEQKTALDWAFGLHRDAAVALLSPRTEHEEIHPAVVAGETDRVRALLDRQPDWANRKTSIDGTTLLHEAVCLGHEEIVELLLSRGADPHARSYTTPLKMAQARRLKNIVEILRRYGATR